MEKRTYLVGDRVDKFCEVCGEGRGHIVATTTKQARISRVSCPKCGTRSRFNPKVDGLHAKLAGKDSAPYEGTRTYRVGQTLIHLSFGAGEVTALVGTGKIDVLFSDRVRRLVHANPAPV